MITLSCLPFIFTGSIVTIVFLLLFVFSLLFAIMRI